jgi:hypothetical protein
MEVSAEPKQAAQSAASENTSNQIYTSLRNCFDSGGFEPAPHGLCVSMLGVRASGKTHALCHLVEHMHKMRKYTAVFLFSATAHVQESDSLAYIPRQNKFVTLEMLPLLLSRQQSVVDHNKRLVKNKAPMKDLIHSRIAVILDDFVNMNVRSSTSGMTEIFTHGRHLGYVHPKTKKVINAVDTYCLAQDLTFLSPTQRSNIDYCFSSAPLSYRSRKMCCEDYLSTSQDRKVGYSLLQELSIEPYRFICVHVTSPIKNKLSDFVMQCKCKKELPKFKIGTKEEWEYDKLYDT